MDDIAATALKSALSGGTSRSMPGEQRPFEVAGTPPATTRSCGRALPNARLFSPTAAAKTPAASVFALRTSKLREFYCHVHCRRQCLHPTRTREHGSHILG